MMLIIILIMFGLCQCDLRICFNPKRNADIATVDSVGDIHADMVMPNSFVAYVCSEKTIIKYNHVLNSRGTFSVTALMNGSNKPYAGKIKQFAANEYSYDALQKWDPTYFKMSGGKNNKISEIPILRSVIIAQGLIFSKPTGNEEVFLRLEFNYKGNTYTEDTKSFKVLDRIKGIEWVGQPPSPVLANHPFDVALKIVGDNGQTITKFAFPLTLMLTAAYHHKYFFYGGPNSDNLYASEARFNRFGTADSEVIISKLNNDDVVQKTTEEIQNGIINFRALTIVDPGKEMQLNATLVVPKGWFRVPFQFDDFKSCTSKPVAPEDVPSSMKVIQSVSKPEEKVYTYSKGCGTFLSKQFEVTAQTTANIEITERHNKAGDVIEVLINFPLPKIILTLVDQKGFRVYGGPDADSEYDVEAIYLSRKPESNNNTDSSKTESGEDSDDEFERNAEEENNKNDTNNNNNNYNNNDTTVRTNERKRRKAVKRRIGGEGEKRQLKRISEVGLGDEKFFFRNGRSVYQGAFHDDHIFQRDPNNIQLCFNLKSNPSIKGCTRGTYLLSYQIHIAFFGNLESTGTPSRPDPLIDAFVRFAVKDINDHEDQFPDLLPRPFELNLTTINTKGDIIIAMKQFLKHIQDTKDNEQKRWKCIIGFGEEKITNQMLPFANHHNIYVIGVNNYRFSHHPHEYYSSLTWNEHVLYHNIGRMFAARNWHGVVLIYTYGHYKIDSILREHGIKTVAYINIPDVPGDQWDNPKLFYREMDIIANSGTKIVLSLLRVPISIKIFNTAYEKKVSGFHGYQWISPHEHGLDFPIKNGYALCNGKEKPTCTEMMQGFMIMGGINDLDYSSTLWQRVHQKFFSMDMTETRVTPRAYDFQLASTYARGYDAVVVFSNGIKELIKSYKTINLENLKKYINTEAGVEGLTGLIQFSKHGRRNGFRGFIMTIYPGNSSLESEYDLSKPRPQLRPEVVLQMIRYVKISDENELIEIRHEANDFTKDYLGIGFDRRIQDHTLAIVTLPRNAKTFPRKYKSYEGIIDDDLQIIEDGAEEETYFKETIVMEFDCGIGCGGNTRDSINFEHGTCIAQNNCRCKTIKEVFDEDDLHQFDPNYWNMDAYKGVNCEIISCHRCQKDHGNCTKPEHCECLQGYSGVFCETPTCGILGCGAGVCRAPMKCDCPSGFIGDNCEIVLPILLGPILFAGALLLCCLQNIFSNYRERQKMQELLLATDWLVRWEDVYAPTQGSDTNISMKFRDTMSITPSLMEAESTNENVAEWKNHTVFLEIFKGESLDLSKSEIRMQFIVLKQLNHPNLSVFIGACVKSPNVALLTEYYPKGSLQTVLNARNIPLDWDVKFSLLTDIAKGMEYLHASAIESHGRLTSTNCLIDNRWGVRISGFGVRCMRDEGKVDPLDREVADLLLWTAPELLRKFPDLDTVGSGTRAGDVYSIMKEIANNYHKTSGDKFDTFHAFASRFSIIIGEVITEERPFNILRSVISPGEIIMLLKRPHDAANRGLRATWIEMGGNKEEYPRPIINEDRLPEDPVAKRGLNSMMRDCWDEDFVNRPSFRDITTNFLVMRPVKGDLVDLLIRRLEKHSTKLEEQFIEASKELQVEKKKVEEILSRMLPKKIVENLIHGRRVDAEEFENVTIGFCDIADFVHMTRNATAFQVIELLNDLYLIFDSIIESFDVYKVETVRDEYMVSSGLPVRNGFLHASEVATLALHLMSAITTFEIKYMPGRLLMLRMGIHTGPCVAGVVGYHMPRYCLFGDTINTASRMKSSSTALRIHISESCNNVLKILGGFKTTYRGQREVKGRGKMHTYWLTGKSDFTKPLPDISLAVDESEQYFK